VRWAAAVYVTALVLDHADGELARLTHRTSAFGHAYDRVADLAVKIAVFAGMGLGLRGGPLGDWALIAGVAAGVAFVTIFMLRSEIARRRGDAALAQPHVAGFELEDILYVVAPVTWLGWLGPFVLVAGVGAPVFALWIAREYRRVAAHGLGRR
jgi:archaetidylinositol phosphate synthase